MQKPLEENLYAPDAEYANVDETAKLDLQYPLKPVPEAVPKGNSSLRFVVSVFLFGAFYYFFVSKNLEIITWLAIIVFIHELGHYFAMKIFNYQDLSIFFIPLLGAIAGGNKEKIYQKEKAIVLLAGPVPGIIIGISLFLYASHYGYYSVLRLSYAFVLINLLNLLPLYPLDGGQLLKTLFIGSRELVTNIFIIVSVAVLIVYAVANEEWFLLVIPYFLVTRLIQEWRLQKIRNKLGRINIAYQKSFEELSDGEYWQIRDVALTENPRLSKEGTAGEYVISENESEIINYVKSVLKVKPIKDLSVLGVLLFLLVWIAAFVTPLLLMTRIWMMI